MLFNVSDWSRYLEGAIHNFGLETSVTESDLIRVLLGGGERARMLAAALRRMMDTCAARNVYVLTNNQCLPLVHGVMQWLAFNGECAEPFPPLNVICTKFTGLVSKAAVVELVIEHTASGDIDATLRRWQANALAEIQCD